MEKRGNRATRRDGFRRTCRTAKRQDGSLRHSLVAPQRTDGGTNPFPIHSASVISATVIDRRYRGSSGRRHEPSKLRWIAVDCGGLRPKKKVFFAAWQKMAKSKGQPSGVDYREIREIREKGFPIVRVFRVFRGEKASFLSLLSLFVENQWKFLSLNHLHPPTGYMQSTPIKPNQGKSSYSLSHYTRPFMRTILYQSSRGFAFRGRKPAPIRANMWSRGQREAVLKADCRAIFSFRFCGFAVSWFDVGTALRPGVAWPFL